MPLVQTEPDAISRAYARSLYEVVDAAGGRARVEETLAELEAIREIARADPRFGELLASRSLNASTRHAVLERVFKGRVSDTTCSFLLVLNEKGRIAHYPAIVASFDSLVQEKLGRVEVDVYTAAPLDAAGTQSLRERITAAIGREIVLHPYVEPSMLGGIKIRIADYLVDASVATKLRRLKDGLDTDGAATLRTKIGEILGG